MLETTKVEVTRKENLIQKRSRRTWNIEQQREKIRSDGTN